MIAQQTFHERKNFCLDEIKEALMNIISENAVKIDTADNRNAETTLILKEGAQTILDSLSKGSIDDKTSMPEMANVIKVLEIDGIQLLSDILNFVIANCSVSQRTAQQTQHVAENMPMSSEDAKRIPKRTSIKSQTLRFT